LCSPSAAAERDKGLNPERMLCIPRHKGNLHRRRRLGCAPVGISPAAFVQWFRRAWSVTSDAGPDSLHCNPLAAAPQAIPGPFRGNSFVARCLIPCSPALQPIFPDLKLAQQIMKNRS